MLRSSSLIVSRRVEELSRLSVICSVTVKVCSMSILGIGVVVREGKFFSYPNLIFGNLTDVSMV
jgi:hypothetical protein